MQVKIKNINEKSCNINHIILSEFILSVKFFVSYYNIKMIFVQIQ